MASASQTSATTAGKEDEIGSRIEVTSQSNGRVEDESPQAFQNLEEKTEENKKELAMKGCDMEAAINGEKPSLNDEKQAPLHERLNGDSKDENQRHEKPLENGECGQNCVPGEESSISHEKDDKTNVKNTQKIAELKSEDELKNHDSLIEDTVAKTQKSTTDDIAIKENTAPPRPKLMHRHSPNSGNPERKSHTGGCHKFFDEESKAEYMKIKSEVTGEAETSESEDEEEVLASEHSHPGRHSSPDSKTKAEYRKIKYEVTGEALTSESEDENCSEGKQLPDKTTEESSEEWMDVFGNGLLKRRILREGKGRDTRPDRGQMVMVRTAGRLTDGTPVDWNQCLEFILGEGEVIQAWDVGIALIELNEVCELVTDARYAYGEQGRSGDQPIPPNAKITYEIELLAVRDGPDMDTMIDEDRIKIGDKKKELGNDLFSRGDYAAAINCYQRAIKYLSPSSDENVQALRIKCWNNLAATQLKIKAYSAALTSCQQVLTSEPGNVKALFRKGKVLAAQGELKEAINFIKKASQNEPANKTIRTELASLRRQLTSQSQQEKDMYEKMVGGLMESDQNSSQSSIFPWSFVVGAAVVVLGGMVAALYVNKH